MAAHFVTKGPFPLKCSNGELSAPALRALWKTEEKLSRAFGVYIFAVSDGERLLPIYVGKSDRGFRNRLNGRHCIFEKIKPIRFKGDVHLFLLARVTTGRQQYKEPRRKYIDRGSDRDPRPQPVKLKSVSRLEFALIGHCLRLNPKLANDQETAFHSGLIVPGYLNDSRAERDTGAFALAQMLGTE